VSVWRRGFGLGALALGLLALAGCSLFDSSENEVPLPGQRLSVLALEPAITADPELQDITVALPTPIPNADWPQSGGIATHATQHLDVPGDLSLAWRTNIGTGSNDDARIVSSPIVAGGRVFAMDANGVISALDAGSGKLAWEFDPRPEDDEGGFGGGLAFAGDRLFATTGYGAVLALDPANGKVIWQQPLGVPIRAAPAISGERLFVVSYDNQTWALNALDGGILWSHAGIAETARLLGAASPAVERDVVVVPYSSGELYALRVDNGRVAWSEALNPVLLGAEGIAGLNTINGSPVIDGGLVYAISHGGRLAALDLQSGNSIWEQSLSGLNTPWLAGDFIYLVTADGQVLCLSRERGRIRWVQPLPNFEDPEDRDQPITWSGPILISNRLLLVASSGDAVLLSPFDGRVEQQFVLPAGVRVAPVAAGGAVYVLTESADLIALR
jgi:outer membrane protein assembly factor BamB